LLSPAGLLAGADQPDGVADAANAGDFDLDHVTVPEEARRMEADADALRSAGRNDVSW
jgi:hypothetical protein